MARPRKHDAEKRTEQLNLRLTMAEVEAIRGEADKAGLSVADYVRRRAVGLPVAPAPRKVDAALVSELNRVGVNLNQVARSLHTERPFRVAPDVVLSELRQVLAKVAASYGA